MSKILIVTPELAELAPVGGIAEYVFGLAGALLTRGHDVRVALPAYEYVTKRPEIQAVTRRLVVRLGFGASEVASVHRLQLDCPAGSNRKLSSLFLQGTGILRLPKLGDTSTIGPITNRGSFFRARSWTTCWPTIQIGNPM